MENASIEIISLDTVTSIVNMDDIQISMNEEMEEFPTVVEIAEQEKDDEEDEDSEEITTIVEIAEEQDDVEVKDEIESPCQSPHHTITIENCPIKEEETFDEPEEEEEEDEVYQILQEAEDSDYNEEDEEEMFTNENDIKTDPVTSEKVIEIIKNECDGKNTKATTSSNNQNQEYDQATKDIIHAKCEKQLMKILSSINSRICHICKKRFDTKALLNIHINKTHNHKLQKYICPLIECDRKFSDEEEIIVHIRNLHLGHCYACSICNMKSKAIQNISKHIRTLHPSQGGRPKDFEFEDDHIPLDHVVEEPEDKKASDLEDVPLNQRIEKPQRPKPMSREKIIAILQKALFCRCCHICNTFYEGIKVFKAHFETVHNCPVPKKRYMCPQIGCVKRYSQKETLQRHIKTSHFGFYYRCSICQKKLNNYATTSVHLKKAHPGEDGRIREFRKNPYRKENSEGMK